MSPKSESYEDYRDGSFRFVARVTAHNRLTTKMSEAVPPAGRLTPIRGFQQRTPRELTIGGAGPGSAPVPIFAAALSFEPPP